MNINLARNFTAEQRPFDRASFRYNAPRATVARTGWFATILAALGF